MVGASLCQLGTQRHGSILNTGGVTTTNKYLLAELCHSCELQSTLRQSVIVVIADNEIHVCLAVRLYIFISK